MGCQSCSIPEEVKEPAEPPFQYLHREHAEQVPYFIALRAGDRNKRIEHVHLIFDFYKHIYSQYKELMSARGSETETDIADSYGLWTLLQFSLKPATPKGDI